LALGAGDAYDGVDASRHAIAADFAALGQENEFKTQP